MMYPLMMYPLPHNLLHNLPQGQLQDKVSPEFTMGLQSMKCVYELLLELSGPCWAVTLKHPRIEVPNKERSEAESRGMEAH